EESGLYEVQVTVMTAMPGTPLYSRLRDEGRLLKPEEWEACTVFDVNVRPTGMTADELREGFAALVKDLYSDDAKRRRAAAFRRQRRAAAVAQIGERP
ncbi:MAG: DUF4070 domain-containing protein, partial [Thermomicrobiales bacterium]|nr:DUF4070 domain-containing protein [Thermomicrobiales bacterium]